MDRNQFQSAANELLDAAPEAMPDRPLEDNYAQLRQEREGYSHGSMASQQAAAIVTNDRLNGPYFEHAEKVEQLRMEQLQNVGEAREAVEQRVEQSQNQSPNQPAEQVNEHKIDQNANQEAKQPSAPENEQSQQQEFDWNRYTQDRGYAKGVDELLSKQQQQSQQNINSLKR